MEIEFICPDDAVLQNFPVLPAKRFVPDWYKEMPLDNQEWPTIKHCLPVQDYITSGYIIQNTYEVTFKRVPSDKAVVHKSSSKSMSYVGGHPFRQFPIEISGLTTNYIKINQPWTIKTPPGYSCLIYQPEYLFEDRFRILPGIVDTDSYDNPIGLVGYLLKDDVVLSPGEPLVCVMPFKRDDWTARITRDHPSRKSVFQFYLEKAYRKVFHKKKSFR